MSRDRRCPEYLCGAAVAITLSAVSTVIQGLLGVEERKRRDDLYETCARANRHQLTQRKAKQRTAAVIGVYARLLLKKSATPAACFSALFDGRLGYTAYRRRVVCD